MKHIFASGEEMYGKNRKKIEQGELIIQHLDYDEVKEETLFKAVGRLNEQSVSIDFKIKSDSFRDIQFRHSVKILMQSDLVQAEWDFFHITYI